ncbi:HAD family hydrolase [Leptospira gomenensis]|uniref:HAD family hydrolase n=1 Tax=Leptospira gomenensis TaxID=2484974 RepID=UPI003CCC89A1
MISRNFWTPELYELFSGLTPGKAAFDFDNTLVKNDFGEAVMERFLSEGVPAFHGDLSSLFRKETIQKTIESRFRDQETFRTIVLEEYNTIQKERGLEASYRWSSWIFSGHSPEELASVSKEVWNSNAKDPDEEVSIKPYRPMIELVEFLRNTGWEIWIVTASPEEIIQSVSERFGISPSRVLGMRLRIRNGIHTSEIEEPFTYGNGKVERFLSAVGTEPDLAFGDSVNDFPLLKSARKVGVFLDRGKGVQPPNGSKIQPISAWNVSPNLTV